MCDRRPHTRASVRIPLYTDVSWLGVRVRVNSSVRRAGRDRVRVSNQDVVETGYAPSTCSLMSGMTFTTAYYVYIRDSPSVLSTDV